MKDEIRDLIERVAEVEASKEELSKFNKFNLRKIFHFLYLLILICSDGISYRSFKRSV